MVESWAILWSGPALEDLRKIRDYVSRDRPEAARRLAERIVERVEALARLPQSGRVVPEIGLGRYRELIVQPYRLIYELGEDRVVILRVWHARRALPTETES